MTEIPEEYKHMQEELDRRYDSAPVLETADGITARLVSLPGGIWDYMWTTQDGSFGKSYRPLTIPETLPFLIEGKVDPSLELDTATEIYSIPEWSDYEYGVFHGIGSTSIARARRKIGRGSSGLSDLYSTFGYSWYEDVGATVIDDRIAKEKILLKEGMSPDRKHFRFGWDILLASSKLLPLQYDYCAIISLMDTSLYEGKVTTMDECSRKSIVPVKKEGTLEEAIFSTEDLLDDPLFIGIMGGRELAKDYLTTLGKDSFTVIDDKVKSKLPSDLTLWGLPGSLSLCGSKLTKRLSFDYGDPLSFEKDHYLCLMLSRSDEKKKREITARRVRDARAEYESIIPHLSASEAKPEMSLVERMKGLLYGLSTVSTVDLWELAILYECGSKRDSDMSAETYSSLKKFWEFLVPMTQKQSLRTAYETLIAEKKEIDTMFGKKGGKLSYESTPLRITPRERREIFERYFSRPEIRDYLTSCSKLEFRLTL